MTQIWEIDRVASSARYAKMANGLPGRGCASEAVRLRQGYAFTVLGLRSLGAATRAQTRSPDSRPHYGIP